LIDVKETFQRMTPEPLMIASVLSSFNLSLFSAIHALTVGLHPPPPFHITNSKGAGKQIRTKTFVEGSVIGKKKLRDTQWLSIILPSLLVYTENRIGPKTQPCGRTQIIGVKDARVTITCRVLSAR
jgi:hypothetical protein